MIASGVGLLAVFAFLLTTLNTPPITIVLASSSSTFKIDGEIRAMPTDSPATIQCEGPTAMLIPGVTRCLVYQVHNTLDRPIEVQNITMRLDPSFPSPPSGCSAEKLLLPSFSGVLQVPANGHAETAGLPIQLKNTPTNQDNCREKMLHFTFVGAATYTEPSSPGPNQDLPGTGAALGGLILGAGLLVSAGWILLAAAKRRRDKASS
ncbi:hypothetical protein GCM10025778_24230 [Paeniglutamicibacter antarcticus]|uniref:LPXTG-motif cell wall-anchored protein n=2 Tax=Paeniglutamicibacter antarcticus TaxID=494023 RepID=A0ABP9TSE6_9MICC